MARRPAALLLALLAGGAAPQGPVGEWSGSYVCAQGLTALELHIAATGPDTLRAVFRFHPAPRNPNVPEGCFAMQGRYQPAERRVALQAGAWLLHPSGYVTVNLAGRLDAAGNALSGTVDGPGCTSFTLRRLQTAATGPRACASAPDLVAQAG